MPTVFVAGVRVTGVGLTKAEMNTLLNKFMYELQIS